MVRWCEERVNQGLLPMTIYSEEESNLCCACHLLNCDEGQGQMAMTAGFWYKVNGARQKKRKQAWRRQGSQGRCSARLSIRLLVSS
jgi:hypothetical protein